MIKLGPAGLGGVKQAVENLKIYHELGLRACEIAFTYGVYIKNKEDAERIGKYAKKLGIRLSIHAPYWINLNSEENKKIQESKERILNCCKVGDWLGAYLVIFHPGYYGKREKHETYENIKNNILDIQNKIKENKWKTEIAVETTGKINNFGSIDEIARLVEDTKCRFCIDFAHILARYKKIDYDFIFEKFKKYKDWHVHFSGIEYGEKGERRHKITELSEIKDLLRNLERLKDKNIIIINESPDPVGDSLKALKLLKSY